ncbi:sigma-70 family RNA polymerase sigma factor [Pontiellaceae bacterium B1224]|nr:sigma-70 family RNA polymerase sigma factor [Pontiellaceae bacterium B1224]
MSYYNKTSYTLLSRACDTDDEEAWNELVGHYGRFILYILGELGVPEGERHDVMQNVLVGLTRTLKNYDRSRSTFRNWLGTVIRNTAVNYFRKRQSRPSNFCEFESESAADELKVPSDIHLWIESEWATYIGNLAMERVQQVFKGQAIEAFELGLDGKTAAEIAEETGLTVSSVYTLRKRVKQRLLLEVRSLTEELEL